MPANQQNDAQGVDYDNSLSIRTVHDSSTNHPWFAKTLETERQAMVTHPSLPFIPSLNPTNSLSDTDSELTEEMEADIITPHMQSQTNESK